MGKLFPPPDMHDGATVSHDSVTYTVKNGVISDVPDGAMQAFIESHGFTGTQPRQEVKLIEVPGPERIVEVKVPGPVQIKEVEVPAKEDDDPNSVPELKIDEMKRGELFAALRGLGVVCVPPITNDELRLRLHNAVREKTEAASRSQA